MISKHTLYACVITVLLGLCTSTRIISPSNLITNQLVTPRMSIGNSSQHFNFTSSLVATDHSLCHLSGWTTSEIENCFQKTILVYGFQGCSYEKVAKIAQSLNAKAVIFQSRQRIPGKEATYTDGSTSPDITIPLLVMGNLKFDSFRATVVANEDVVARITSDTNPWATFTDSPAPVVIQMLGTFTALVWIVTSIRGLYFSFKFQQIARHTRGTKVILTRVVLFSELLANAIRLSMFVTDPFLIRTTPLLSWAAYIILLIIHVPIGFVSSVCFVSICLLILVPSKVFLLKAFLVGITLAILGVDLGACGTNAAYRNPRGVDIYAVSFTLNGVEGFLLGATLAACCVSLLRIRNKQIRYSPRALKRIAVIGLAESFFLVFGSLGSFMIAWLASEAAWLDVFSLCVHWIGLFGASGCQIACFPKGKRLKKIKVIKVVDNDFHTAHPMRTMVF